MQGRNNDYAFLVDGMRLGNKELTFLSQFDHMSRSGLPSLPARARARLANLARDSGTLDPIRLIRCVIVWPASPPLAGKQTILNHVQKRKRKTADLC